ncbi:MAG: hypothetical protein RJB39_132 [Candidatus Parcubacteria bacterium]|jgi:SAM-dependent methyltransferase
MNTSYSPEEADKRFEPVSRSKTFNRILDTLKLRDKKVLDLGCSFGEFLVKFGPNSCGITTTTEEVEYGKLRNLRILQGNAELIDQLGLNEQFDAVWANNIFEHLLAPHAFLMKLKTLAKDNTLLVLGVPVIPRIVCLMKLRKFNGALASPHTNFFTRETLKLTVERAGWKVKSVRPYVFSVAWLDTLAGFFTPHLYIEAYADSKFAYPEKKVHEWKDDPMYKDLLRLGNRPQ